MSNTDKGSFSKIKLIVGLGNPEKKLLGRILYFSDFIARSCAFSGSKLNIKGLIKENIKAIFSTFFPLNQLSL